LVGLISAWLTVRLLPAFRVVPVPPTMYMVTSGTHFNDRCCFDYGNAETNNLDDGAGTMVAVSIYFGSAKGGRNHGGPGPVRGSWPTWRTRSAPTSMGTSGTPLEYRC
jgi:hypothetical protein